MLKNISGNFWLQKAIYHFYPQKNGSIEPNFKFIAKCFSLPFS